MSPGVLDSAFTLTVIFVDYPFGTSGWITRADINVEKTTGTLLLAIFRRTTPGTICSGSFQRVREVAITRTQTGINTVSAKFLL